MKRYLKALCEEMSSEDESDEISEKETVANHSEAPSSRQAKKVARLKQISYQNEHKDKIRKVSKILKKKDNEITEEDREVLKQSPEITNRLSKLKERRGTLKKRQLEIEDPLEELERKCLELANAIRHSNRVVVYTGAGISTAASIPDYRGPNGVWTLLQKGQQPKAQDLSDAKPTLTHMSIKKLQDEGHVTHVVSQNCDGLHMRSGLNRRKLSEVHGNMYIEVCYSCKPHQEYIRLFDVTEKTGVRRHQTDRNCHTCKEPLKDTIVHFGEKGGMKCPYRWKEAAKAADKCDIILCLGSSLKILKKYSCLWCMDRKVKDRPKLYIVNLQWTPRDDAATVKINGRCDEVLKRVMRDLGYEIPIYLEEEDPIFTLATKLLKEEQETTTKKILEQPDLITKKDRKQLRMELFNSIKINTVVKSKKLENGCVNHANQNCVKVEPVAVKLEPSGDNNNPTSALSKPLNNHTLNHTGTINPNQAVQSVMDNKHLLDFSHLNRLLPAPSIYPLPPPLTFSPLLLSGLPGLKSQVKFGEVSFPKYLSKGDNQILPIKFEQSSTPVSIKRQSAKSSSQGALTVSSSNQILNSNSSEMKNKTCAKSEKKSNSGTKCIDITSDKNSMNETKDNERSSSKAESPRGRRTRKTFCPNCHGVRGECPCTLLESSRKKKPAGCRDCIQNSCTCTQSLCGNCKKTKDKCDCQVVSKCGSCGLSKPYCKCSAVKPLLCNVCGQNKSSCKCALLRPSICQFCKHTPDKCTCVLNGHVEQCVVCEQHKTFCKCMLNHTSSVTQGEKVPKLSSVSMPTGMSFVDYAKFPFPLNNFSPFYLPQVFQNFQMNGLFTGNSINPVLPSNPMILPSNQTDTFLMTNSSSAPSSHNRALLPGTNALAVEPSCQNRALLPGTNALAVEPRSQNRALLPRTNALSVEPILQDHSYLSKVQMQSLSPNCDIKSQRSPKNCITTPCDIKQGMKRSYSYVDDIPRSEDDIDLENQKQDFDLGSPIKEKNDNQSISEDKSASPFRGMESSSTRDIESSSPIIIDDEEEELQQEDSKEEKLGKPKLMRSVSVPGWFGKGLNLKKRRR